MSGWIKIIVEFINELAGQWKGSSDPNAPSETVDIMAEEEPVADSVAVRPESHQIGITSEASPNKQEIERRRETVRQFFNDLRAERDGGLTPRLGNSLASRIDLAPNNRLRSRSRRSRRGGLRGCLRPAAKRATASETDHAASLKKIVWISRRRSRSIHSRRVRITPRFGRVGRCKRPSPSRTACLPCASRPGRLPRCPIHGTSKNQYL